MNSHNEIHDSEHDHDESEDSYTPSDSASENSEESIESFSGDLKQLRHVIATINSTIEILETQLISIQRPIEALHMEQLGDTPFLESSPFRHTMLKFKLDVGIPGLDTSKRYSFADIMKCVRTYLFKSGAVLPNGSIVLKKNMRKMLGIKEETVSYVNIMNHIRQIVY
jgi:hypothetical protein